MVSAKHNTAPIVTLITRCIVFSSSPDRILKVVSRFTVRSSRALDIERSSKPVSGIAAVHEPNVSYLTSRRQKT
jgi:hypothetical protein